jgi:uncharacterized YccA/Bax inhibitor family protein
MRSSNPALSHKTFNGLTATKENAMTLEGTVTKTALLLVLLVAGASVTWKMFLVPSEEFSSDPRLWIYGTSIAALAVAIATIMKKQWAGVTAPIYAILEGMALGAISSVFEFKYPGIVIEAVALTFGTLFSLLMAYRSRIIKPTENFKLGVTAATGAIALYYIVSMGLGFFGIHAPLIHESGPLGIGFSVVVVILAALNLVLDFDFIEGGVTQGAPKYMEWYGAFGLIVTLAWLYLEILRLLSKTRSRK